MKPTPEGWPRISASVRYEDAATAIDWLCNAFGFEVRLRVEHEDGSIAHSELVYGDGLVMVGDGRADRPYEKPPARVEGANTQSLMVFVDDADAHCAHAREAGAVITMEPTTQDYGEEYWADRTYQCRDIGGHHWWFVQRVSTGGKPVG